MSILQHFDFSSLTGITSVTTSGTVALDSGTLKLDVTGGGDSNTFGKNGAYQTTGISLSPGHVLYGQIKVDTVLVDCFYMLTPAVGVSFTNAIAIRLLSNAGGAGVPGLVGYDDVAGVNFGSAFVVSTGTYYDLKYEYVNGGGNDKKITVSARVSDSPGSLNPSSSAWTVIGTSTNTYTPGTFHIAMQQKDVATHGAIHTDEWIWTDDGTIGPPYSPPTVNAGTDQTVISSDLPYTLSGASVTPGTDSSTTLWTKVSGPGTATFGDATVVNTTVNFSVTGTYILRLTATDDVSSYHDDVTFQYDAPPIVDAGPDQSIVDKSVVVTLAGSFTDDGLPNPPGSVTTTWTKVSGPGTATISNIHSLTPTVSFSLNGYYTLRLTADDGKTTSFDEMHVSVSETVETLDELLLIKYRAYAGVPSGLSFDETKRDYFRARLATLRGTSVSNDQSVDDYMNDFFRESGFEEGDLDTRERLMFIDESSATTALAWEECARIWALA